MSLEIDSTTFWTDSEIVLRYLRSHPADFKTFTGNRLAELAEKTVVVQWRHIRSELNCADVLSRGATAEELINHPLWLHAPPFFRLPAIEWPAQPKFVAVDLEDRADPEVKRPKPIYAACPSSVPAWGKDLLENHGSWLRTIRIMGWVKRFVRNVKSRQ